MRDKTIWMPLLAVSAVTSALYAVRLAESRHAVMTATTVRHLEPPPGGQINVAFVISWGANVIDTAGAWEVFEDTMLTSEGQLWKGKGTDMVMPFNTYTVSDSPAPVDANGLVVVPSFTFANAPQPRIIAIPAQGGRNQTQKSWLLDNTKGEDVTMSVCTGAQVLAAYDMLDGEVATTHHLYERELQQRYPAVHFINAMRFVENDKVSTAAGLTSGSISPCTWRSDITDAPSPRLLPATWSITAHCGRIPSWPPSRRRQPASRSLSHRVGCLPAKPGHLQEKSQPRRGWLTRVG